MALNSNFVRYFKTEWKTAVKLDQSASARLKQAAGAFMVRFGEEAKAVAQNNKRKTVTMADAVQGFATTISTERPTWNVIDFLSDVFESDLDESAFDGQTVRLPRDQPTDAFFMDVEKTIDGNTVLTTTTDYLKVLQLGEVNKALQLSRAPNKDVRAFAARVIDTYVLQLLGEADLLVKAEEAAGGGNLILDSHLDQLHVDKGPSLPPVLGRAAANPSASPLRHRRSQPPAAAAPSSDPIELALGDVQGLDPDPGAHVPWQEAAEPAGDRRTKPSSRRARSPAPLASPSPAPSPGPSPEPEPAPEPEPEPPPEPAPEPAPEPLPEPSPEPIDAQTDTPSPKRKPSRQRTKPAAKSPRTSPLKASAKRTRTAASTATARGAKHEAQEQEATAAEIEPRATKAARSRGKAPAAKRARRGATNTLVTQAIDTLP